MAQIAHLRVHSDFSLSEGASKVKDLVARAKELEIPALGLTDKDSLYGLWEFSEYAPKGGVQPIVGAHLSMPLGEGKRGSFVLLAQNETGYKNLCAVVRAAYDPRVAADGTLSPPPQPEVEADVLAAHAEGVIMLTGGGADGVLPQLVAQSPEAAAQTYQWLLSVFCDRLYVEVCRNGRQTEAGSATEERLIALAYGSAGAVDCTDGVTRAEAPLVATTDVWYATPDRHEAWLLLKAVVEKRTITIDGDSIADADPVRYHLRSEEEMRELFADLPEALENTIHIARRSGFRAPPRKPILPPFACEGGRTEAEELAHQGRVGLEERLDKMKLPDEARGVYRERLEFELSVINKMGFPGYFLIVSDFIKWAKANDIPVGPGRGSGAGSVVAWALVITDLDPLEFGLLFERFLNPERVSMPDFDVDFCETRRSEVIQYVQKKYGSDLVSMIATFTVIKAKTALKDAGRVIIHEQHGTYGYGDLNEFCKLVPDNPADPKTLSQSYDEAEEFRQRIDESPKMRALYERALGIEGLNRGVGQHAAGVIIGDRPLHELFPVVWNPEANMPVCSFNMKGAEASGAVKFDFLGLKTLTIIQLAVRYIKEFRGEEIDISVIPRDDDLVYARLAEGHTTGVFQLEGGGMRKALRQVKPTRLEDIIAVNALYRPGPMANIPEYAERKHGKHWESPHPDIHDILAETHGIMIYQEQVMSISQVLAGYSLGGADLLRRAMGKKIRSEMEAQRKIFVDGAVGRGVPANTAGEIFDLMEKFAEYGFNKSHAAAYAWIAYQTAWLKVHFPVEFFAATMSFNMDKPEQLTLFKEELDDLGIPLLPPDINHSYPQFRPEPHPKGHKGFAVRFGMGAIKQISGGQDEFLAERAAGGFKSLEDFHRRAGAFFNKAQFERLSEAGAFTGMAKSRRQAANVLGWLAERKDKAPKAQTDLFGGLAAVQVPQKVLDVEEWGDVTDREFKAVGFYFTHHPIDPYVPRLKLAHVKRRQSYAQYMIARREESLRERRVCVMVDDVKSFQTARGNAFIKAFVSEKGDSYQISCFDNRRRGVTIDHFRRTLEGAKMNRRPVVFLVDLTIDRSGEGVYVNGRDCWGVDDFLADVRGEIVIEMDAASVRPIRPEEKAAIAEAQDAAAMDEARLGLLLRRIDQVVNVFETKGRPEDGEPGVPVRIEHTGGLVRLPGRFRFPKSLEAVIQTVDGVVSMREDFSFA